MCTGVQCLPVYNFLGILRDGNTVMYCNFLTATAHHHHQPVFPIGPAPSGISLEQLEAMNQMQANAQT